MPSNLTNTVLEHFAEVVFSTNEIVLAQCYKEVIKDKSFEKSVFQGHVVKVVSSYDSSFEAFGIVSKITNSSLDNIHRPSALGLTTKELEQLQPQVFELLRREIEIYLFAHKEKGSDILAFPPSRPVLIHDFVFKASNTEILNLTEDITNIINLIRRNQLKNDLLVNVIGLGYELRKFDYNYLVKAGKEISLAYSDDLDSLMQLLKRLSYIVTLKIKVSKNNNFN